MTTASDWTTNGEAIVVFAKRPPRWLRRPVPRGVHRLPGPLILLAERFDSPVGPFAVFSIVEPALSGLRPGFHISTCVVNNGGARVLLRQRWGIPTELGAVAWSNEGVRRSVVWPERGVEVRAHPRRFAVPFSFSFRVLQRRLDRAVVVPTQTRGRARRASIDVKVQDDDPLSFLRGPHRGWHLSNAVVRRAPARSSRSWPRLRAPRRLSEPGVVGMGTGGLHRLHRVRERLQ